MPVENPGFEIGNIPAFRGLSPQDFVSTGGQVGVGLATRPPQIQPISAVQQQQAQLQLQAAAQNNQINQIALQKAVKDKQDNDALDLQVQKLGKEIASTPNPDELSPFAKALYKAQLLTGTPVVYTGAQMQQVMTAAAQRQAALAQQADIAQQAQLRAAQIGQIQALTAGTGGYRSRPQVVQTGSDANGVPTYGSVSEDGTQITPIAIPNSGAVQKKNPPNPEDTKNNAAILKTLRDLNGDLSSVIDPATGQVDFRKASALISTLPTTRILPNGVTQAYNGNAWVTAPVSTAQADADAMAKIINGNQPPASPGASAASPAGIPQPLGTATGNSTVAPVAPNPFTTALVNSLKGTPGH